MSWHRFALAELPATPWKNGGGTTREVAAWPPGASVQDFDWRISVATIAADGPFSAFAGIDRVITLLSGAGVHLSSQDGSVNHQLNQALQPFAFSGDVALDCDLLGGPSQDFNVMTRRGRILANVSIHRAGALQLRSPHGLLLARSGRWQLAGRSDVLHAGAQDGVYWAAQPGQHVEAEALDEGATLIAVALQEVAAGA